MPISRSDGLPNSGDRWRAQVSARCRPARDSTVPAPQLVCTTGCVARRQLLIWSCDTLAGNIPVYASRQTALGRTRRTRTRSVGVDSPYRLLLPYSPMVDCVVVRQASVLAADRTQNCGASLLKTYGRSNYRDPPRKCPCSLTHCR